MTLKYATYDISIFYHGSEVYMTNASFGVVSYVFKSVLGIERQKKPLKKCNFDPEASEPS